MKPSSRRFILSILFSIALGGGLNAHAFVINFQEQGGLIGGIGGGGGPVIITPVAPDHWTVTVQDPRIGNQISPAFNLAFTEPELVSGLTAYNNILLLSTSPGILNFDVLSDEFSPYSDIRPNNSLALFFATDQDAVNIHFLDIADTVPEPTTTSLLLLGAVLFKKSCRRKLLAGPRL